MEYNNNISLPLVSVIIPAFNASNYIEETLVSVCNQEYPNIEIIVVDDGSEDDTSNIVKQFDATYIYQENKGLSSAMNTGFTAAKGAFIASVDADDLWLPKKISLQMELFQADPSLDMVFCHIEQFLCPKIKESEQRFFIPEQSKVLPGYTSIAMLIKKTSFFQVGLFNEAYKFGDFIEWYSRAKDLNLKQSVHTDILALRRIHKSNMSSDQPAAQRNYMEIIKERLARQRKANTK
ncbi:glycosyltransferase family 2 protein [Aquimarina sp. 2201CG14-23]|uniref:glycosyltransferase family 2 protein n=1 Tax=Aquimarina mycalae TaxID=3040073 RepID=UPI002477FF37|nr:glycosyltransferase family A protein [Aquimarina sp. 2201CG14-23]MDH7445525.1 glycosyltransferase family A protein [Aquimarina sp. 2201CG14-23]